MRRIALGFLASPESVVCALRTRLSLTQALLAALACARVLDRPGTGEAIATIAAVTTTTAIMSLLATQTSIDRWVLASTLMTGIPFGVLSAWQTMSGPSLLTLGFGVAATADLGLFAAAVPVYVAARLARSPTRDSLDRMLLGSGAWLGIVVGTAAVLATSTTVERIALLLAIAVCVVAGARMIARRRWLARVVGGREAGLAVVPGGSFARGECLPLGVGALGDSVIVEETPAREGPFRGVVMRALFAPLSARSDGEWVGSPASRLVLGLAVVPVAAALGTLALAIIDETLIGTEYSVSPSHYHGVALSTVLLSTLVVLVGTHAPLHRWLTRVVVLALPAGIINGGIALMLVMPGHGNRYVAPVECSLLASLVSVPSALVIGGLIAWMSAIARRVAREGDDRSRAVRALAPFVITSGVVTMLGMFWQGPLAIHGGLALVIGLAMLAATSERFRAAIAGR